ncbi:MAG TPA: 3'(2'),5'-bisphosphate nucleotidase [bacterium]|nr:3'(2'),5'-bisphosphate nucleotidase [Candidatus Omnitrophota bacterium]HOJ62366.1 3'(2'),5'-bisphosphate nucleotidase [bacterium]HOL96003.1 3'(2'),5'-bisphosphate nucleotidase [bacterium]HPP02035.1 3'(2'),5'-bisphosphate nucleotidase [bacterium]HXK93357.1 3'(2'),5'-bisphosphate nucleotidase [bacterium]
MGDYDHERKTGIEAVSRACRVCQLVQSQLVSSETVIKADRSPVTAADFSSQAVISLALQKAFPGDPLAAEESAADLLERGDELLTERIVHSVQFVHGRVGKDKILAALESGKHPGGPQGRFWVIDPIDGTQGFLRREQYAVSLALVEEGQVVLGILGCPNYPLHWLEPEAERGFLFVAVRGEGAVMRSLEEGWEKPIQVSDVEDPAGVVVCEPVESAHSSHEDARRISERLGIVIPPLRLDSQCKYAAVARADASIYLRLPTRADYQEKIWDHAAGWIILKEAGGEITGLRGDPLDFSRGRTLAANTGIVATNGRIHARVLEAAAAVLGWA